MIYAAVRTYGNGKHISSVYPLWFEWLSQAERVCKLLNAKEDNDGEDKWIVMPMAKYIGPVWAKGETE